MTEKLTKTQLEALQAVYHKGDPHWLRTDERINGKPRFQYRAGAGGATTRMIGALHDQGYLDECKLTAKGYAALSESKAAMKFIDEAELATRWAARVRKEADAAVAAEEERRQRAERRRIAEETSRRERLAKLHELVKDTTTPIDYDDDELLAFAARVHEIMEVY